MYDRITAVIAIATCFALVGCTARGASQSGNPEDAQRGDHYGDVPHDHSDAATLEPHIKVGCDTEAVSEVESEELWCPDEDGCVLEIQAEVRAADDQEEITTWPPALYIQVSGQRVQLSNRNTDGPIEPLLMPVPYGEMYFVAWLEHNPADTACDLVDFGLETPPEPFTGTVHAKLYPAMCPFDAEERPVELVHGEPVTGTTSFPREVDQFYFASDDSLLADQWAPGVRLEFSPPEGVAHILRWTATCDAERVAEITHCEALDERGRELEGVDVRNDGYSCEIRGLERPAAIEASVDCQGEGPDIERASSLLALPAVLLSNPIDLLVWAMDSIAATNDDFVMAVTVSTEDDEIHCAPYELVATDPLR